MSQPTRRRRTQREYDDYVPEQNAQSMGARDQAQVSGGYYISDSPINAPIQQYSMRFTDEQLDSLNRTQLIIVLQDCYQMLSRAVQVHGELKKVNGEIESIQKKLNAMNSDLSSKKIVIGVIAVLFVGLFTKSMLIALMLGVALTALILYLDQKVLRLKRQEKAEEYRQRELPPLQNQKQQLEEEYAWISASDSWYNAQRLLPEKYLSLEAIEALISSLQTRRARSLSEAFDAYENQLYRQRIEEIEKQKLQVAQEAAAAQAEAARAQKRAAEAQAHAASVKEESAKRMAEQQRQVQRQAVEKAPKTQKMKECSYCKMRIPMNASVCPYCRNECTFGSYFKANLFH